MPEVLDINNFLNRVQQLQETIRLRMPDINESVAAEAFAVIRRRVTTQGEDSTGQKFGTYSTHELPLFFYENKGLGNKGDAAIALAEEEGRGLSYEEWRQANGLQTAFKDFQFSGDTWRDMGVVLTEADEGAVITTVGPEDKVSRASGLTTSQLVSYLADRNGNFVLPSELEQADLGLSFEEQIIALLQEVGLA